MYTLIFALVVPVSFKLPDFLWVSPLIRQVLPPGNDAVISPLVPVRLTGDGLPPGLLYQPQLLQDVDVVSLEAVAGADVPSLPGLLELPPYFLGVALSVLEEVFTDEEAGGVDEG